MLHNFFSKPIELKIGEQTLKFSSLTDFKFSLSARTSVPSQKIIAMFKLSLDELEKEAQTIKEMEKSIIPMLSDLMEQPDNINRALREMNPRLFSHDHGWRSIIQALCNRDEELNHFRRVALVKYIQYLSSRHEIVKYLYSEKKHQKSPDDANLSPEEFKETMLENTAFGLLDPSDSGTEMERMLKGENVTIGLTPGKEVNVLLSKHKCKIIGGKENWFVDESGHSHKLRVGKNVIGRDAKNDITIDSHLRDISRIHLLVELDDTNHIYMTDLSSHGTYLPTRYMKSETFQD